jgi:thiamine biosynthesis lipoprotein
MRPLLGTYVEVGTLLSEGQAEPDFARFFAVIEKIHQLLSYHDPESDLSRLNLAKGHAVEMNSLSIKVLRLAKIFSKASGGLFNPTVGGQLLAAGCLPKHGPQEEVLPCGHESDIEISKGRVKLRRPVHVVLDGIAKGYAVDLAINLMRKELSNGWVNAGGDVRAFGELELPIQRRTLTGELENMGGLKNLAMATSQVRTEHSQDFPAWMVSSVEEREPEPGVWSVLAKKAWRADALTKVLSIAAESERENILHRLGGARI